MDLARRQRAGQEVADGAVPPNHVHHLDAAHGAAVSGLAAALRVEQGVGGDGPVAIALAADLEHLRVELGQVGVALVRRSLHGRRV